MIVQVSPDATKLVNWAHTGSPQPVGISDS
jgi:hypothetical protein